jgi:glycosyltransferase involved in cell wall biosynthesis
MTTRQAPATAVTKPSQLTVVTVSGHRQANVDDSADFRTWTALADRLGRTRCVWAGPRLECRRGGMDVFRRPRRTGPRSLLWAVGSVRIGVRLARAAVRKGEVVVVNGAEPWGWLAAWFIARLVRRPWLMDIHGDLLALPVASLGRWRRAVLQRAVFFFARRATGCRVVAQSMLDALGRHGISSVLVPPRLLPVWEQPLERTRPPLATASPQLLTVGRLVSSKGYDLLLAAMAELVRTLPALRLRIVGDGPLRAGLADQADRLGLSDHVEFLGTGDIDEVRSELSCADLFVISSRDEGLPRTLLEATAAGVPVVATSVGGIPTTAAGWDSVTVVAPDAASIAAGVRQVLASPPSAEQLASVRRHVLAAYGFDTNIDALADLFRRVGAE